MQLLWNVLPCTETPAVYIQRPVLRGGKMQQKESEWCCSWLYKGTNAP